MSPEFEQHKLRIDRFDVVSKFAIAAAVCLSGILLQCQEQAANSEKERFNKETQCWKGIQDTMDLILQHCIAPERVTDIRAQLPKSCGSTTQENVNDLLSNLARANASEGCRTREASARLAAAAPPDTRSPETPSPSVVPPASAPAAGSRSTDAESAGRPTVTSAASAPPATGWVAVGFLGTRDFNFTDVGGQPLTPPLAARTIIRARWPVSVRAGAADWRTPPSILGAGACFAIADTKPLPAGSLQQLWAQGAEVACP